jgi:hypothetical protein
MFGMVQPADTVDLAVLHTVEQLHERYDISEEKLLDLLRDGELVGFKLGRRWYVHADDWNAYIDALRAQARDGGA